MPLFSKSRKVQYLCGKCRSPDVTGPVVIHGQQSLVCQPCAQWMPWTSRVKVSVATYDDAANRANFQAYVVVKYPKASISKLMQWFQRYSDGTYRHGEIEELWRGWNMHKDFVAGSNG